VKKSIFDFSGKTAVVTGGSGVIGGAICRGLAAAGANVVIVANTQMGKAQVIADEIRSAGGSASVVQADVLARDSLRKLAEDVIGDFGTVDLLVNGAGGAKKEATTSKELSFFDLPEEAVRNVLDLNFLGTFFACQVFGKIMVEQGRGAVLNISSLGAVRPLTRSVAYSAGKAAVTNFTQWLAVHFSQEYQAKIRVNAIVPGFFLTEQNRFLLTDEITGELTERGQRIIRQTPMGRFGSPDELVPPALFLLSDAASFIHGETLVIDGGLNAYGGV